jgi:hypothetical protein
MMSVFTFVGGFACGAMAVAALCYVVEEMRWRAGQALERRRKGSIEAGEYRGL